MKRKSSALWIYLDSIGILESGSTEEIEAAKRAYWKQYHYNHRRAQRTENAEITVALSRKDGTYKRLNSAAQRHGMTLAAFLRAATESYLSAAYILPDRAVLAHLETLLASCANAIQAVAGSKERYFWQREHKIEVMEATVMKLEDRVRELFLDPPKLEHEITKALERSPEIRTRLLALITSHDHQDKIKKE